MDYTLRCSTAPTAALARPLCAVMVSLWLGWAPASQAGSLHGQVTDSVTGLPLADSEIQALDAAQGLQPVRSVRSDASGRYLLEDLPPGYYLLRAAPPGHRIRLASDRATYDCSHSESAEACLARQTPMGQNTLPWHLGSIGSRQVDFASAPAARMRGQVGLATPGSAPPVSVQIGAGNPAVQVPVDPLTGGFTVDHVQPGIYEIGLCAAGAICRDASGAEFDALGSDAARLPLALDAAQTLTLPRMELRPAASISLALPFAEPLYADSRNLPRITAWREGDMPRGFTFEPRPQDLQSLRPGRYRLLFGTVDDARWHARWHDGTDCTRTRCDAGKVMPIVLDSGETRAGVTVELQSRQRITGQILQPGRAQPIPGMLVAALKWEQQGPEYFNFYLETLVSADAEGRYAIDGLAADAYVLIAANGNAPAPWLSQRWPGVRCASIDLEACLPVNQNQFVLQPDQHADGVDFTPELGGIISGEFSGIGQPALAYVELRQSAEGMQAFSTYLGINTAQPWSSVPVPVGTYYATGVLQNDVEQPERRQVFSARGCSNAPSDCPALPAAPIAVRAGQVAGGVDFHFGPALPPIRPVSGIAKSGRARPTPCLSPLPLDQALGCRMQLRLE